MHTEKMTTGEAPCDDTRVLDKPQTRATGSAATRYPVMKPVKEERLAARSRPLRSCTEAEEGTGWMARPTTLQSQSFDCRTR